MVPPSLCRCDTRARWKRGLRLCELFRKRWTHEEVKQDKMKMFLFFIIIFFLFVWRKNWSASPHSILASHQSRFVTEPVSFVSGTPPIPIPDTLPYVHTFCNNGAIFSLLTCFPELYPFFCFCLVFLYFYMFYIIIDFFLYWLWLSKKYIHRNGERVLHKIPVPCCKGVFRFNAPYKDHGLVVSSFERTCMQIQRHREN